MFRDTGPEMGPRKKVRIRKKCKMMCGKEQLAARQRRAEGDPAHGEPQLV